MAVQQNRKTPSRRGMRRSHDKLGEAALSSNPPRVKRTFATMSARTATIVAARLSTGKSTDNRTTGQTFRDRTRAREVTHR